MKNIELINFRHSKKLTITEMASSLGISKSFYEKIEYGDRFPSYNFQYKFKKIYPDADIKFIRIEE